MNALAFLLSLAGFAVLCSSMTRHERDLFHRTLSARAKRYLRLAGFCALAAAYATSLAAHGFGYGTVLWCGLMSVAAGLVVTTLTARASRGRRSHD